MRIHRAFILITLVVILGSIHSAPLIAQSLTDVEASESTWVAPPAESSSLPSADRSVAGPDSTACPENCGIDWKHLFEQSGLFLGLEQGFRLTQGYTREPLFDQPFFQGYINSIRNLHGWNDGDPFAVNYLGHPIQGAITIDIWNQNDRAYRSEIFGRSARYWRGKLRGTAFAFFYSLQFEIGPFSEASIGNVQATYPQQGLVDHVITPSVGLGEVVAEDALDRYVVRRIEARTTNRSVRAISRMAFTPARTMTNLMSLRAPWYRSDRPSITSYRADDPRYTIKAIQAEHPDTGVTPPPGVAPFEFAATGEGRTYLGDSSLSCAGGGGAARFRVAASWQIVVDIDGCKTIGLPLKNVNGDSLSYLAGPRWTKPIGKRWSVGVQSLVGGTKLSQEPLPQHEGETTHWSTNGLTLDAGTDLTVTLTRAFALQVVRADYAYSWTKVINGADQRSSLQVAAGLVLRVGTW